MELQIADINKRLPQLPGAEADSGVRHAATDPGQYIARMQEFYEDQANLATDERVGITLTAFREIAQAVAACRGEKVWCGYRERFRSPPTPYCAI